MWPMLVKEFIQLRRDRPTLAMMVGVPAIQLMLFGFAIRPRSATCRPWCLTSAKSSDSRALVQTHRQHRRTSASTPTRRVATRSRRWIESGKVAAAIVIPPDFTRDLARHHTAKVQVIVDAADPLASQAAMSGAAMGGQQRALDIVTAAAAAASRSRWCVRAPSTTRRSRSAIYIVPGIIGVLLSMTLVIITAMAVVRERERGTLEQLVVTPITRTSLMLGKLAAVRAGGLRADDGHPDARPPGLRRPDARAACHCSTAGRRRLHRREPRRSASCSRPSCAPRRRRCRSGFLFLLPNILLSGFMFPREAMPEPAQWIGAAAAAHLLPAGPARHPAEGRRDRRALAADVDPDGIRGAVHRVSVRRFHKTVE